MTRRLSLLARVRRTDKRLYLQKLKVLRMKQPLHGCGVRDTCFELSHLEAAVK